MQHIPVEASALAGDLLRADEVDAQALDSVLENDVHLGHKSIVG